VLDNGNWLADIREVNPAINEAVGELERLAKEPGIQSTLNVGRQLAPMGKLLSLIAQEQETAAEKTDRQIEKLVNESMALRKITYVLMWLTVALLVIASVQVVIMLRDMSMQSPQHTQKANDNTN
jgi:K+-transporting ATPase A subunit